MTRRHLLDAAGVVFAEKGFHGATLDEVAARAGFTKGAVYSNFKNKDDLFVALLSDRIDRQFAVAVEMLETGSREVAESFPRVREIFRSGLFFDDTFQVLFLEFVLYAARNPEAHEKLVTSTRRAHEQIRALMKHEYAVQSFEAKYPLDHLAAMSRALFNGLALERLIDPDMVSDEMLDTTLALLYEVM